MAFIKVLSVLLIVFVMTSAFLCPNCKVSAVDVVDDTFNKVISLPFPSPESFGEASRAIVMYNSVQQRYTMYVLTFTLSPYYSDPSNIRFYCQLTPNSNNMFNSLTLRVEAMPPVFSGVNLDDPSAYFVAECRLYRFNWYVGQSNYTVARRTLVGAESPRLVYDVSENNVLPLTYTSGKSSDPYELDMRYNVCYNGAWCDKVVNSNISYSFASSDSGAMLSILNEMNTSVTFYLNEILNQLKNGDSYSPSETTTNADMSNFEHAEGALMDDNISKLNDMSLPDLNNFNSGNQGNAFQFISSNIEFFSGMNGNGSIAKVGTVLVVILGLGLTSFIIGLTNRRKGD